MAALLALVFGIAWLLSIAAMVFPFSRWFPYNRRRSAFLAFLVLPVIAGVAVNVVDGTKTKERLAQLQELPKQPQPQAMEPKPTRLYSEAAREGERRAAEQRAKIAKEQAEKAEAERKEREAKMSYWDYRQNSDMHGTAYFAQITSTNSVAFGFPYEGGHATLTIRKHPKYGTDVIISVNGHFVCNVVDDCLVAVKFDDKKVVKYTAAEPADYSSDTLFIRNASKFIANARKAKTVTIEATFYQEGDRQFTFPIQNLEWKY